VTKKRNLYATGARAARGELVDLHLRILKKGENQR
jgi:hypothetical protein